MIPFAANTAAETPNAFQCAGQPPPANGISISSAVFAQYVSVTDTDTRTDTDIQTTLRVTSVAVDRIYAMHAMRPYALVGSQVFGEVVTVSDEIWRSCRCRKSKFNLRDCASESAVCQTISKLR